MASEDTYVSREGWLQKMGHERPSWKKRYFVLEKNQITYYSADKDAKNKKNPKGTMHIDFLSKPKIRKVETGTVLNGSNALSDKNARVTLKKSFLFQIGDCKWKETGLRSFYVCSDTDREREDWIQSLIHNCDVYTNSPEGKEEEAKIPESGERREAYNQYIEAKRKAEEKAKQTEERKAKTIKNKAMREEPWYKVHTLCSKGTVERLQEAVAQGMDVNLLNPNGGSTLLQASTYGNVPVMKYLLDCGLDINGQSNGGNSALHAAACMGFIEAAELLLQRGCDTNLKNREGKTAAQAAKTHQIQELISRWGQNGEQNAEATQEE